MTECIGCVYANKHGWENQPKCEITGDAAVSRCAYYRPSCPTCKQPMTDYINLGWTCDHCEHVRTTTTLERRATMKTYYVLEFTGRGFRAVETSDERGWDMDGVEHNAVIWDFGHRRAAFDIETGEYLGEYR